MGEARLTTHDDGLREVVFGRHVMEALVPGVEQEVADRAGEADDGLAGLTVVMVFIRRGGQLNKITISPHNESQYFFLAGLKCMYVCIICG